MDVLSVVERAAARHPWWEHVWAGARAAAARLEDRAVGHDTRVLLAHHDSDDLFAMVVACWQLNAIPIVIDPSFRDAPYVTSLHPTEVNDLEALVTPGPTGPLHDHDDNTPVLVSLTSGTTGTPKAAVLGSGAVALATSCIADRLDLRSTDTVGCAVPFASSYQLVAALLPAAHACCRFVSLAGLDGPALWPRLDEERVTVLAAYGPTLSDIAVHSPEGGTSLRLALSGGAPLAPALKREYRSHLRVPLIEGYGQSELGGFVAMGDPNDTDPRAISHAGRPLPDRPAWVEPDGEIVLWGKAMLGYLDRPEEAARALAPPGLHTGDVGLADADGYIRVLGRQGGQLPDGRWPRELDDALYGEPGVQQAAVVVTDGRLHGFIQSRPGATLDPAALAQAHGLETVTLMDALPRTFSGKINRSALA